jgi:hypothetical protein
LFELIRTLEREIETMAKAAKRKSPAKKAKKTAARKPARKAAARRKKAA